MTEATGRVTCDGCMYWRRPARANPYSASLAANPSVQQAWINWEEAMQEEEQAERLRFKLGSPFPYPPKFYSWCRRWTDLMREYWEDKAGMPIEVYELTARRNAKHDCPHYEAGEPEGE